MRYLNCLFYQGALSEYKLNTCIMALFLSIHWWYAKELVSYLYTEKAPWLHAEEKDEARILAMKS